MTIDCPTCGRHCVSTNLEIDDLSDIAESLKSTGFCCDLCEDETLYGEN